MDPETDTRLFPDDVLLERHALAKADLAKAKDREGRLEVEILRRMEERGATSIPSEHFVCESPVRYEYPPGAFTPLKELFNEVELGECYRPARREHVPAHFEDLPESWDTRKVLSIARKRGTEAEAIIERQRVPKSRSLKFEPREAQS